MPILEDAKAISQYSDDELVCLIMAALPMYRALKMVDESYDRHMENFPVSFTTDIHFVRKAIKLAETGEE